MSLLLDVIGWQPLTSRQQLTLARVNKAIFVFPHTSKWDIFIYFIYRWCYSAFRRCLVPVGPAHMDRWGCIFSKLGCVRATAREETGGGMTGMLTEEMKNREQCILLISPKGTTGKREWRSGYYWVAKNTGCAIMVVGFDFVHHCIVLKEAFFVGEMEEQEVTTRCQLDMKDIPPLNVENVEYPLDPTVGTATLVPASRKRAAVAIVIILIIISLLWR